MLDETLCRLALQYLPNYGNVIIKKMIEETGNAGALFHDPALHKHFLKKINRSLPRPVITDDIRRKIEEEYLWMKAHQVNICFVADEDYPRRFQNCHDAPYLFYYKGKALFNPLRSIAIVGTRNASGYGKEVVKKIASELSGCDVTIISGLAEGIDTAAHEEALSHGLHTLAVLGSGLGRLYPSSNRKLAEDMVKAGGGVISEFPYKTAPDRCNFPRRNRIIAALADAVVVAESALKGGSIITAYIAHSYNRDVFAVPGSVFQGTSAGCHELIRRNMAAIITSGKDLLEMMGWNEERPKAVQRSLFLDLTEDEKTLVALVERYGECPIDLLHGAVNTLTPSKIAGILLGLELKGVLECRPGKIYRMI